MPLARTKRQEAGAPAWMLTLGDITMLLLTFFVLLITMMSIESPRIQLPEVRQEMRTEWREENPGLDVQEEDQVLRGLEELASLNPGAAKVFQIALDSFVRVSVTGSTDERWLTTTIGGAFEPFAEGDWTLQPGHRIFLDRIKRWHAESHDVIIVVRGHTDVQPHDSVACTATGEIVPYAVYLERNPGVSLEGYAVPGNPSFADFHRLATLRALEVFRYLTQRRSAQEPAIPPGRIRIEVSGPDRPASSAREPDGRQPLNRRVEIEIRTKARFGR